MRTAVRAALVGATLLLSTSSFAGPDPCATKQAAPSSGTIRGMDPPKLRVPPPPCTQCPPMKTDSAPG